MIPFTVSQYYEDLYWPKVHKTTKCWDWLASTDRDGYGQFNIRQDGKRRTVKAHLVSWWLTHRYWPTDLEPDHTCNMRSCVNPDHLEWVTHAENKRREVARREYCRSGLHRYSDQIPLYYNGQRRCRLCTNDKQYQSYWSDR